MPEKINQKTLHKAYFTAKAQPSTFTSAERSFLTIAREGASVEALQGDIGLLYSVFYHLKFALKAQGLDFAAPFLEAL